MPTEIDSYKIGNIAVRITETGHDNKFNVICNDGNFRSEFTIRPYEYKNYRRHMNQRIKNAYKQQYNQEK